MKEIKSAKREQLKSNMKIIFRIFAVFIFCVFLLLFVVPGIVAFIGKRQVPEMTPEKAQKLFQEVGGINEINREAGMLLNRPQTNDWPFLFPDYEHVTTNAPAIASLYSILKNYSVKDYGGTAVGIWPENGKHIAIGFGNHWVHKQILIFDPDGTNTFDCPSNWFQVSSNIFVSR